MMLELLLAASLQAPPLHVFLRGGPKTHGPNQHEHERFVAEWVPLLASRGAEAEGALHFPTESELARTDVLVIYAADGGSIHGEERAHLESYLARGGGLVVLHDGICTDDPAWFQTVAGGAWEYGRAKWHEGLVDLDFADREHPIARGIANFRFQDEIYTDLHVDPKAHVLAQGFQTIFEISPQAWTFEKDRYRAFVAIQGHEWSSFSHPAWRAFVLRGIAWAGRRDVDSLVSKVELVSLAYAPGGPIAPEKSAGEIALHPDFDLSLVASEPLIQKPISIDWDARGRMWIAETPGYPEKERFSKVPGHDRISILEDKDGDGRMDSKTVFRDGLDLVTSLVVYRDGAIVAQAPDILFVHPDRVETLFTGFGFGDTHAVMSNFRFGVDGWIYGTQGYSGEDSRHVVNAAGKDFGHIGNGVFRFRPDGSAIEMVCSAGSNMWGLDFSDEGELFFTMANGQHLRHVVVPERVFDNGRTGKVEAAADCPDHDRVVPLLTHTDPPYAQIDFVGGFTAASGCCLYTGGAWPAEWRNAHFTCEPTVHIVHHDVLTPKGVTFAATKARPEEFLAGKDLWFRPIHLRVGPDGAMYLLDFYNQAIVHNDPRGPEHGPTNAAKRPDRDHEHGRIWRIQHKRAVKLDVPDLARADAPALAKALEHPNGWVRGTAERLLVERGKATEPSVRTALSSKSAAARIAGLWILEQMGECDESTWRPALADADPSVRKQAIRVCALDPARKEELRSAALAPLVADSSERVRLAALVALGDLAGFWDPVKQIVHGWPSMQDPWARNAAVRVAAKAPGYAILAVLDAHQELQCRDLAVEAVRRVRGAGANGWLVIDLGMEPNAEASFTAAVLDSIGTGFPSEVAEQARQRVVYHLGLLLRKDGVEVPSAALRLAERWKIAGDFKAEVAALADRLGASLESDSAAFADRLRALSTLLSIDDRRARAIEDARALLAPSRSVEEISAVVAALTSVDDAAAARDLCAAYDSLSASAQDKIFEALAARASSAGVLLDAIEKGEIKAADLSPARRHRLRNHPDPRTAERATRVLGAASAPPAEIEALITRFAPDVERPGDATHGRELFTTNCATCHKVGGEGGNIGPDLTGIGVHAARDLLTSILDPNRAVEPSYTDWVLETTDGRVFGGVLARESSDSVLLRSSGGEQEVARADIESLRNTRRSPMPTGFEILGPAGLRDLVAYLAKGTEGFRVLDLSALATSNSHAGLYDTVRDAKPMRFAKYGVVRAFDVPFEILSPERASSGCNAIVLKGGPYPDWECKARRPQRVEIPVGFAVAKVHVLGGIAAFGYPFVRDTKDALKWTWAFEDGTSESVVLKNGVEIGDWIRRSEVPGSKYVEGLLAEHSWGELRYHALAPSSTKSVHSIVLESFDNELAPTIFALTAELPGPPPRKESAK